MTSKLLRSFFAIALLMVVAIILTSVSCAQHKGQDSDALNQLYACADPYLQPFLPSLAGVVASANDAIR